MITFLLVAHFCVTLALIGIILIQRNEGSGLGIGSGQGMGAFMSGRGATNFLTRTTAILATLFMVLSLVLAIMYRGSVTGAGHKDILDQSPQKTQTAPATPSKTPSPATTKK